MANVVVVIGPGLIGQAIARRVGSGTRIVLADIDVEHARRVADSFLDAGFDAVAHQVDVSSREAVRALAADRKSVV